jgi:hypothetical protein
MPKLTKSPAPQSIWRTTRLADADARSGADHKPDDAGEPLAVHSRVFLRALRRGRWSYRPPRRFAVAGQMVNGAAVPVTGGLNDPPPLRHLQGAPEYLVASRIEVCARRR